MTTPNALADVVYHGRRDHRNPGPAPITIETPSGEVTGLLHNHARDKSPDGFSWAYEGSGCAATAKSLLVAALGDLAKCPTCAGTQQVMWCDPADHNSAGEVVPVPWDGRPALDAPAHRVLLIESCYDCGDGYRSLPYQDFKRQVVATWGDEFRITRREILAWLVDHYPGFFQPTEPETT